LKGKVVDRETEDSFTRRHLMAKASKAKEIILVTANKVGTLVKISEIIAGAGGNINAILARGQKTKAYFHIFVDPHIRVRNALKKANYDVTDEGVILVEMPNKPGEMQKVALKLADAGIDILYSYGSAGSGRSSFCIFKTDNDKKALKVIKGK
jgi:hypothetical protein